MTVKYVSNPELPIIKEGWKGNAVNKKTFLNENGPHKVNFKDFLRWQLYQNPQKNERKNDPYHADFFPNDSFMKSGEDVILWLGHSSFYIRLGGVTFLTDPAYFDFPTRARRVPIPCSVDCFKYADYLLVSHLHHDHADMRSLRKIFKGNKRTEILGPLESHSLLGHFSNKIQEAGWFQKYNTKADVNVYFLPSYHWSRMHIFDNNHSLWGSFIIQGNGKTIYFGGDTAQGDHFKEIAALFPKIDYALLPIGAYKPRFINRYVHMSPEEAVDAAAALNAKHLVPMHYGTYPMGREPISEPIRIIREMDEDGEISCILDCPAIGEELFI
jgi:Predicted Zn-dependent hydrolases of the beta-lactamase fold